MVIAYTGRPRSGKTFSAVKEILRLLRRGKRVLTNVPVRVPEKLSWNKPIIWTNDDFTMERLWEFADKYHDKDKDGNISSESQTMVVIDEAHLFLGDDFLEKTDRANWTYFFSQHGKAGFDFIIITQDLNQISRPIRRNFEIERMHFKLDNFPIKSTLINLLIVILKLMKIPLFAQIETVIGLRNNDFRAKKFYLYNKDIGKLYNTYKVYFAKNTNRRATNITKQHEIKSTPQHRRGGVAGSLAPDVAERDGFHSVNEPLTGDSFTYTPTEFGVILNSSKMCTPDTNQGGTQYNNQEKEC